MFGVELERSGHLRRSRRKRVHHRGIAGGAILLHRGTSGADMLRVLSTMVEQRTWRNGEHQECH